jgi:hypothetical protein
LVSGPDIRSSASESASQARQEPAGNGWHACASESLKDLPRLLQDLGESAAFYAGIRKDVIGARAREAIAHSVLVAFGVLVVASTVAVSVGLLLLGVSRLLGSLFGGRLWLGEMITGLLGLAMCGGGTWVYVGHRRRSWRDATARRYDELSRRRAPTPPSPLREGEGTEVSTRQSSAGDAGGATGHREQPAVNQGPELDRSMGP